MSASKLSTSLPPRLSGEEVPSAAASARPNNASSRTSGGESHRVYWQQWLSNNNSSTAETRSRRELITSSAAIRIAHRGATAQEVTTLLRSTLNLESFQQPSGDVPSSAKGDSLVLVGTLYSMPRDFVQFEHELEEQNDATSQAPANPHRLLADPFHVVKTLQPTDAPLVVKDQMTAQLIRLQEQAKNKRSAVESPAHKHHNHPPKTAPIIAPKIQWFFVPKPEDGVETPISTCIELDGYCTSMEEEYYETERDDSDLEGESSNCSIDELPSTDELLAQCKWFVPPETNADGTSTDGGDSKSRYRHRRSAAWRRRQLRRARLLSSKHDTCLWKGYLRKQSDTDAHVWRRVFCMVTQDAVWYTTRISQDDDDDGECDTESSFFHGRIGLHHGRIPLERALCQKTRNVWNGVELVSAKGLVHTFQASSAEEQHAWMATVQQVVRHLDESLSLSHADLIIREETLARHRRLESVVLSGRGDEALLLLPWMLGVASYREMCRHMKHLVPSKGVVPIVVARSSPTNMVRSTSHGTVSSSASTASSDDLASPQSGDISARKPPHIEKWIQNGWDEAAQLLSTATKIALHMQTVSSSSPHPHAKVSTSLETACRHIDYVITGKRSPQKQTATTQQTRSHHHDDPPPMDLFDRLLDELKFLAAQATHQQVPS